jgi:CRP/FNR family transcriptional regulator, anaerobic regulatory protein
MKNIINFLNLPEENNHEALEEFNTMINCVELKKGDYFLREKRISDRIGFVAEGMLKQYYLINGEEKIRWVLIENDIALSLRSFTRNIPSIESIEAINTCKIYFIGRDNWQKLTAKYNIFKMLWVKNLEDTFIGYEDRIYDLIAKSAKIRYESFRSNFPEHNKKVPLQYLASMLGIAPQHLSRIRKSYVE